MKREYAHEPPIVSVTQLNPEQCEVLLHENINAETRTTTGANGEEQTTVYTAQEYTLIIPWREGIEDSIKANVAAWTEMARKQELEELLPEKLTELDNACRKAIVEGCWVELADGSTQHFALTEADQINLNVALEAVKAGADGYPYHADGELCRVFSAADINAVAAAAVAAQALPHHLFQPREAVGHPRQDGRRAGRYPLRRTAPGGPCGQHGKGHR